MLLPVADPADPRLDPYRDLKGGDRLPGAFVAEGEKLVRRLLAERWPLHSVLVTDRWLPRLADLLPAELPVYVADHAAVPTVIGFHFHRGVLACAYRPPPPDLDALLASATRLLLLPEVADPANLAALVRSAAALGWDGVVVGRNAPDAFSRRCLRVSMGAALRLPVARLADPSPRAMIQRLQAAGFRCVAAALPQPGLPPELPVAAAPGKLALAMGNEDDGLDQAALAACDFTASIPMAPGIDSLNVAVAAGILLHRYRLPAGAGHASE